MKHDIIRRHNTQQVNKQFNMWTLVRLLYNNKPGLGELQYMDTVCMCWYNMGSFSLRQGVCACEILCSRVPANVLAHKSNI